MIRRVRGCEDSLTANPTPHAPHTWVWRGQRVECEGVDKECEGPGCHAPIRLYEDFCSDSCWEWWHAEYSPETLEALGR